MKSEDKDKLEQYFRDDPYWIEKAREMYLDKVFENSMATQNIHTPESICKEMVGKLRENYELSGKSILTLNAEYITVLGNEDITFLSDCPKKSKYIRGFYPNVKVIEADFLKWETTMKFDVVIMNPPYKQNLHLNFLLKAINITREGGWINCVHPSTWLFMENKGEHTQKIYKKVKEEINRHNASLVFFNANKIFGVSMFMPFCITTIHKVNKKENVVVEDKLQEKTFSYPDIFGVNKFGNYKEYFSLLSKISSVSKKDNLEWHRQTTENGEETLKHNFYVSMAVIRGNVSLSNDKVMFSDDFYTFIPRDTKPEVLMTKKVYFGFNTGKEAQNFIDYLKTKFARFSLSLVKCNSQLSRGEMVLVPFLDFKKRWTDDTLKKEFNISQKEWNFIETIISNYYENSIESP